MTNQVQPTSCIIAAPAKGETGGTRGRMRMHCPVCGKVFFEHDLEVYYDDNDGEGMVELCTNCRETFETDEDVRLEADVLDHETFAKLRTYMESEAHECNA